ncbi:MAG TPA: NADPH:quinone reductase [Solibacterales bacterium]|nr:NADPH:quinone reductase [Bryobacterales bacterium]
MKAVVAVQPGGPDQLRLDSDLAVPHAGPGQILVRLRAIGVNFIDTYHRSGLYPSPQWPAPLGVEGVGVVEAVGDGAAGFPIGSRAAYCMARGSYAEYQAVPAANAVAVPDGIADEQAAAAMVQGLTAHYLSHSTFPLSPGATALIHAAAGGTGLLLVQMAKLLGARVIGTVGTAAKAELARGAGADEVILYTEQDFAAETRRLTDGRGVDVVYDSVGASTFEKSLDCLRPRGMMVSFGNASGAVPPIQPLLLSQKGSLYLTRPNLAHFMQTREELDSRAASLFAWIAAGQLKTRVDRAYPLADAAQAHRDLEARKTTGKLVLVP